jgi:hypothetical protein
MSSSIETNNQVESWEIEPVAAIRSWQRRWLMLAIMVVVFCSGAAIGSGLTTISIENSNLKRWRDPWWGQKRMLEALNRELDLSDSQTAEVEQILKNHDQAVKKIWMEEVGPKMITLVKQLDGRIAGVLTTEQQPLWHAWLEKRKSRVCPPSRSSKHPHGHEGHRPAAPTKAE